MAAVISRMSDRLSFPNFKMVVRWLKEVIYCTFHVMKPRHREHPDTFVMFSHGRYTNALLIDVRHPY